MDNIEKLVREIESLSAPELAAFRRWFQGFDAAAWDRQIEEDAKDGKLDKLAEAALKAFAAGDSGEM